MPFCESRSRRRTTRLSAHARDGVREPARAACCRRAGGRRSRRRLRSAAATKRRDQLGRMLAVGVEHDHGVGASRSSAASTPAATAVPLPRFAPMRTSRTRGSRAAVLELGGDLGRRAVVDQDDLVGVAQRAGRDLGDAVGAVHGDHRREPLDRRPAVRRDGLAAPLGPGERHERGEPERRPSRAARGRTRWRRSAARPRAARRWSRSRAPRRRRRRSDPPARRGRSAVK